MESLVSLMCSPKSELDQGHVLKNVVSQNVPLPLPTGSDFDQRHALKKWRREIYVYPLFQEAGLSKDMF